MYIDGYCMCIRPSLSACVCVYVCVSLCLPACLSVCVSVANHTLCLLHCLSDSYESNRSEALSILSSVPPQHLPLDVRVLFSIVIMSHLSAYSQLFIICTKGRRLFLSGIWWSFYRKDYLRSCKWILINFSRSVGCGQRTRD